MPEFFPKHNKTLDTYFSIKEILSKLKAVYYHHLRSFCTVFSRSAVDTEKSEIPVKAPDKPTGKKFCQTIRRMGGGGGGGGGGGKQPVSNI